MVKKTPNLNKTMIEVGKKKVPIPVLDFSQLPVKKPLKLKVVHYNKNPSLSSESRLEESDKNGIIIIQYIN